MGIVSAILLSVVIAFTCGTIVMYISRTIFSFRYSAMLRRFGAFWCGASLTAILYFALFKGLKNLLSDHPFTQWVSEHLLLSLGICWVACSLILLFAHHNQNPVKCPAAPSATPSVSVALHLPCVPGRYVCPGIGLCR